MFMYKSVLPPRRKFSHIILVHLYSTFLLTYIHTYRHTFSANILPKLESVPCVTNKYSAGVGEMHGEQLYEMWGVGTGKMYAYSPTAKYALREHMQ